MLRSLRLESELCLNVLPLNVHPKADHICILRSIESPEEHAVILFKDGDEHEIVEAYPVLSDFVIESNDPLSFCICFGPTSTRVEIAVHGEEDSVASFVEVLELAIEHAKKLSFTFESTYRHNWLRFYRRKRQQAHQKKTFFTAVKKGTTKIESLGGQPSTSNLSMHRDTFINSELLAHEPEFTTLIEQGVLVVTYNVNNKKPVDFLEYYPGIESFPLIMVGLQEVDLTASGLMSKETTAGEDWRQSLESELYRTHTVICCQQMAGLMIAAFARSDIRANVNDVFVDTVATGMLGVLANKGGVGVSMKFFDSRMLFINSHLAAGSSKLERRNTDFLSILSGICHDKKFGVYSKSRQPSLVDPIQNVTSLLSAYDHIFFFGDLNYRLQLNPAIALQYIAENNIPALVDADQLLSSGAMMKHFVEPPINFLPTYKFKPKTDEYTGIDAEKVRTASYCDRVMYHVNTDNFELFNVEAIEVSDYRSIMDVKISDHKPVFCAMNAKIKHYDDVKRANVYRAALRDLERKANNERPSIEVSEQEITFEDVIYSIPVKHDITLTNTGLVPAQVQFVPKPGDTTCLPPWLSVSPSISVILPGKSLTMTLTVCVTDPFESNRLNNEGFMSEIVILHLLNGKDFFITCNIKWEAKVFAQPIPTLCSGDWWGLRVSEVEKNTLISQLSISTEELSQLPPLRIPREIWLVCNNLQKHVNDPDIFSITASNENFRGIVDGLYYQSDVQSPVLLADYLMRVLSSFSDFIIVSQESMLLLKEVRTKSEVEKAMIKIIGSNQAQSNLFIYIISFFRHYLSFHRSNPSYSAIKRQLSLKIAFSIFKMKKENTAKTETFDSIEDEFILDLEVLTDCLMILI
ncbi:hypothetical protein PCE1_001916 [Barthelona sp. PCE]